MDSHNFTLVNKKPLHALFNYTQAVVALEEFVMLLVILCFSYKSSTTVKFLAQNGCYFISVDKSVKYNISRD